MSSMANRVQSKQPRAITLLELLVVVLIISVLATIATGVYTGEVRRARVAATQDLIHQLEIAITRYEVDVGQFPPSGSGEESFPAQLLQANADSRLNGSGYLHMALLRSMSGNAFSPASFLWNGPYINLQTSQLAPRSADLSASLGGTEILDPFGNAMVYIRHDHYDVFGSRFSGGSQLFPSEGARPEGADPRLPAPNPSIAFGETYYNTSTYQIYSPGPDGLTFDPSAAPGLFTINFAGTQSDDINNFGY